MSDAPLSDAELAAFEKAFANTPAGRARAASNAQAAAASQAAAEQQLAAERLANNNRILGRTTMADKPTPIRTPKTTKATPKLPTPEQPIVAGDSQMISQATGVAPKLPKVPKVSSAVSGPPGQTIFEATANPVTPAATDSIIAQATSGDALKAAAQRTGNPATQAQLSSIFEPAATSDAAMVSQAARPTVNFATAAADDAALGNAFAGSSARPTISFATAADDAAISEMSIGKAATAAEELPAKYLLGEEAFSAAGTAAPKGLLGVATRMRNFFPGLAEGSSPITMGSIGTGAGVAMLGLMASGMIDGLNIGGENSRLDQGLTGAVMGAGIGGGAAIALGLASGPIGWAVLGGAALFGIGDAFFGDSDSPDENMQEKISHTNTTIEKLISDPQFNIPAATANQIRLEVKATTDFLRSQGDSAGLDQYLKGLATTVPSFLMQSVQQQQVVDQRMQLQAAYGPVYAASMERSAGANKESYDNEMAAAARIGDPKLRAAYERSASQSYQTNQAVNAAYARQVAGATSTLPSTPPAAQGELDRVQQLMNQAMAGSGVSGGA